MLRIFEIYEKDSWANEYRKTRRAIANFLKEYPESARGWAFYGQVYQAEGDMAEAAKGFQKSYELDADKNIAALIGLGDVARKKGDFADAASYYEKVIGFAPKNVDAYISLLELEWARKDFAKAVEYGEKAQHINEKKNAFGLMTKLMLAYHFNQQLSERDAILQQLEKLNYKRLEDYKYFIEENMGIEEIL